MGDFFQSFEIEGWETESVVGFLEGSDPELPPLSISPVLAFLAR